MRTKKKRIEYLETTLKGRADLIKHLSEQIGKMQEEKDKLEFELEQHKKRIDEMNRTLTEKELYEKKMKEYKEGGTSVAERLCRLEAKIEAQENPYFF